jgi:hypothetical protein
MAEGPGWSGPRGLLSRRWTEAGACSVKWHAGPTACCTGKNGSGQQLLGAAGPAAPTAASGDRRARRGKEERVSRGGRRGRTRSRAQCRMKQRRSPVMEATCTLLCVGMVTWNGGSGIGMATWPG